MMKNILNKTFLSFVLFFGVLLNAQTDSSAPAPPVPQAAGEGGSGDIGGISQPIDMYVIWLAVIAIMFIVCYVKKSNKKIA